MAITKLIKKALKFKIRVGNFFNIKQIIIIYFGSYKLNFKFKKNHKRKFQ